MDSRSPALSPRCAPRGKTRSLTSKTSVSPARCARSPPRSHWPAAARRAPFTSPLQAGYYRPVTLGLLAEPKGQRGQLTPPSTWLRPPPPPAGQLHEERVEIVRRHNHNTASAARRQRHNDAPPLAPPRHYVTEGTPPINRRGLVPRRRALHGRGGRRSAACSIAATAAARCSPAAPKLGTYGVALTPSTTPGRTSFLPSQR